MRSEFRFALPLLIVAAVSCSHSTPATPAAAPTPAAGAGSAAAPRNTPAAAPGAGAPVASNGRGGAGGPGGGRGGPPMTPEQRAARRDSIATLRAAATATIMRDIAGHENEPAGTVFKNVQVLKSVPAKQFVTMMDSVFGRGLGRNCTDCHVANQWASDSLGRKKTARNMAAMVEAINTEQLTKFARPGGNPPKINCITCHRGNPGGPNQALLP